MHDHRQQTLRTRVLEYSTRVVVLQHNLTPKLQQLEYRDTHTQQNRPDDDDVDDDEIDDDDATIEKVAVLE